jgi:hypothetical protein
MPSILSEPLFLSREVSLEKSASHKMSLNVSEWEQDIIRILHQEHPYMTKYALEIKIRKSDEEGGVGIGVVHVDDTVTVPVLIDNFKMYPLDLFFKEGELEPLTKTALESALQGHNMGTPIKPNNGAASDTAISHLVLPPYDGKYAFASALEYTSDQVNGALMGSFSEQGLVYEASSNPMFREAVHEFINHAATGGAIEKQASLKKEGSLIEPDLFDKIELAGVYSVETSEGPVTGIVANYGVQLGLGDVQARPLRSFVGLDKLAYTLITDEVIGVDPSSVPAMPEEPTSGEAVFVMAKEGAILVSAPVTVLGRTDDGPVIRTSFGTELTVEKLASDTPILEENYGYLWMSEDWRLVPIGPGLHLTKQSEAYRKSLPADAISITHRNGRYFVKTAADLPELRKLATDGNTIDYTSRCLGVYFEPGFVDQALTRAREIGDSFIGVSGAIEKVASTRLTAPVIPSEGLVALTKAASFFSESICKEAKIDKDTGKKTIDSLLGLNFLSDETLYKFLEKIEDLEGAKQALAQLLLATRLGLDLETRPLRTALFSLDAAIRDLKELRNTKDA